MDISVQISGEEGRKENKGMSQRNGVVEMYEEEVAQTGIGLTDYTLENTSKNGKEKRSETGESEESRSED